MRRLIPPTTSPVSYTRTGQIHRSDSAAARLIHDKMSICAAARQRQAPARPIDRSNEPRRRDDWTASPVTLLTVSTSTPGCTTHRLTDRLGRCASALMGREIHRSDSHSDGSCPIRYTSESARQKFISRRRYWPASVFYFPFFPRQETASANGRTTGRSLDVHDQGCRRSSLRALAIVYDPFSPPPAHRCLVHGIQFMYADSARQRGARGNCSPVRGICGQ